MQNTLLEATKETKDSEEFDTMNKVVKQSHNTQNVK